MNNRWLYPLLWGLLTLAVKPDEVMHSSGDVQAYQRVCEGLRDLLVSRLDSGAGPVWLVRKFIFWLDQEINTCQALLASVGIAFPVTIHREEV